MNAKNHPAQERLVEYLTSSLDSQSELELDGHFNDCADCCLELDKLAFSPSFEKRIREIHANSTIGLAGATTYFNDIDPSSNGRERHSRNRLESEDIVDGSGRYEFESEVARGGMGIVYAGRDTLLDRGLVLKVLHPKARDNGDATERFMLEARIGGNLQHPGIVPIHDLGRLSDGRPFFSMRRIDGHSFDALLAERANPSDDQVRLLNVLTQVCQTVAYAHSQNIVHRDLKPQNIMVGRFGEVQVVDWGIAKQLDLPEPPFNSETPQNGEPQATRFGQVLGTPTYMSPEQAAGESSQVDKRTDVFALGAILYEILAGKSIYDCQTKNIEHNIELAVECDLHEAFEDVDAFSVDHELITFCKQCLAKDAEQRPSDASCVATALMDHGETNSQRLRQAELTAERQRALFEEKYKRHMLAWCAAIAIAVLCSLLSLGYAYHSSQRAHLTTAISEKLDAYDRTMELAAHYPPAEFTAMLQAFDGVASTASSRTELRRNEEAHALSEMDSELARRLLDAHIWSVTKANNAVRDACMTEAARQYERTFAVFADWNMETMTDSKATEWVRSRSPFLRQAIIDALDDYLLLGKRLDLDPLQSGDASHSWTRFSSVAENVDADPLRTEIRRAIRNVNRVSLERISREINVDSTPSATIYFLVSGLELAGAERAATTLLSTARRLRHDAFWLNGHVLSNDLSPTNVRVEPNGLNAEDWNRPDADPINVLLAARHNMRAKNYSLSLQQFQWLFRNELIDPMISGPRLSTVLQFWNELGHHDMAALQGLKDLRNKFQSIAQDKATQLDVRTQAFRIFAAANRVLHDEQMTANEFARFHGRNDTICNEVFMIALPELADIRSSLLAEFEEVFSGTARELLKTDSVMPTDAMGNGRRQFATFLSLIAMNVRTGHTSEAMAYADDAIRIWSDEVSSAEINAALDGKLPLEAVSP